MVQLFEGASQGRGVVHGQGDQAGGGGREGRGGMVAEHGADRRDETGGGRCGRNGIQAFADADVFVAVEVPDGAHEQFPGSQRAAAGYLGQRQLVFGNGSGGHGGEGLQERGRGLPEGMIRGQGRAVRQAREIRDVLLDSLFDGGAAFGRQIWIGEGRQQRLPGRQAGR